MFKKVLLASALAVLVVGQVHAASVTGKVTYTGDVPAMKPLDMNADPACVKNNAGKSVTAEALVLGETKTVANIFVRVKSGLPADKTYTVPTEPVVLDQLGCKYIPHVVAVMKGQPLKIKNSDGTLHNVHGMSVANGNFNVAMPAFKKEMDKTFDKAEDPFKVKCDVHPWMNGSIAVMDHPYFATTVADGVFTIKDLPAGTYEIEIWHEKLGTKVQSVTVTADEAKTLDFALDKPAQMGKLDIVVLKDDVRAN